MMIVLRASSYDKPTTHRLEKNPTPSQVKHTLIHDSQSARTRGGDGKAPKSAVAARRESASTRLLSAVELAASLAAACSFDLTLTHCPVVGTTLSDGTDR